MRNPTDAAHARGAATAAVVATAVVIVLGALVAFVPYLLARHAAFASVADFPHKNAALNRVLAGFTLRGHQRACMNSVAITSQSGTAQVALLAEAGVESGAPPLELRITSPRYRAGARLPGGELKKLVQFRIRPPRSSLIGTVCLLDTGATPITLEGTTDPSAVSRSVLTIDGKPTPGNFALSFFHRREQTRLASVGDAIEHISNLTDDLVPVWLVWILLACAFLAVPIAITVAYYTALARDERAGQPASTRAGKPAG
jgi:hypothetical protein